MAAPMKNFCVHQQKRLYFSSIRAKLASTKRKRSSPKSSNKKQDEGRKLPCPPEVLESDWISPPDKVSNIRQTAFYRPSDETSIEQEYREKRDAVQKWHHDFWTAHNKSFFSQKEAFIKEKLREKGLDEDQKEALSAEDMSIFYKQFLDENYRTHINYNKEWYKKNISMLWPAVRVNITRFFKQNKAKGS